MDLYLRCNILKCRSELKEKAVVTTCSHIFCLQCADTLGLSHPASSGRRCPACESILVNPDDAVSTILNPTEDYKTSVLSGLDPNTIIECAGRALMFWSYQATQEVVYREFCGKTLTEKYASLNNQMDNVIHNANTQMSALQSKLSDMQITQDQLHKKNQELAELYRDKCKKLTQITTLYGVLKSRSMIPNMQTAATDSVSRTLNSLPSRAEPSTSASNKPMDTSQIPQTPRQYNMCPVNQDGVEQLHRYQRSGTGSSKGAKRADAGAMPPPNRPGNGKNGPTAAPHRTRLLRPSTAMSQLPTDSAMFERFQNVAPSPGYGGMFMNSQARENTRPSQIVDQSGNAMLSRPELRASLFDRTII